MQKNNNNLKSKTTGLSGSYSIPQLSIPSLQSQSFTPSNQGSQSNGSSRNYEGSSFSTLSNSFNKMGLGRIGSLGGTMGDLEKASLRLAQFRANKTEEEQMRDTELKTGMQIGELKKQKEMQEKELEKQRRMGGR